MHRQRGTLRPLGWALILVVVLASANSQPVPGLHGKALAVTLALCVFVAMLLIAIRDGFPELSLELQGAVIAVMGAAGVAIAGLQIKGATEVAAGVAVFIAITRLPLHAGVAIGGAVTVALGAVTAIAGSSSSAVAAGMLVTVLLGVVAQFLKQSRDRQNQTELLLAQLEDARDEQARAAAIAERGRIASELHDVLARQLQDRHEPRRHAPDRRRRAHIASRSKPRALPRRTGRADERHAVRAQRGTTVNVRYEPARTKLSVDNGALATGPRQGMGGGHGLEGLRERIERADGTVSAGPTTDGWRVEIDVPR